MAKSILEWIRWTMGRDEWEGENIDNSFKRFSCKGEQRNGAVVVSK